MISLSSAGQPPSRRQTFSSRSAVDAVLSPFSRVHRHSLLHGYITSLIDPDRNDKRLCKRAWRYRGTEVLSVTSNGCPVRESFPGQIDRTYEEAIGGIGDCAKDVAYLSFGLCLRLSWIPARSIRPSARLRPTESFPFFACNCG